VGSYLHHYRPSSSSSNNNTSNNLGKEGLEKTQKNRNKGGSSSGWASLHHHRHRLHLHPAATPALTALSPTVLSRPVSTGSSIVRSFFSAVNSELNRQSWAPSPSALPGKFSFPSFGKLITCYCCMHAWSDSRMHVTVVCRVTGLDQWPNLFF
jgi:hypothetical protein